MSRDRTHSSQKLSPQQTDRTASRRRSSQRGHFSSLGTATFDAVESLGDAPAASSSLNGRFSFLPISRAILKTGHLTTDYRYNCERIKKRIKPVHYWNDVLAGRMKIRLRIVGGRDHQLFGGNAGRPTRVQLNSTNYDFIASNKIHSNSPEGSS